MVASFHSLVYMRAKLLQSTLTLCDAMVFSVHGIAQADYLSGLPCVLPQGIFLTQGIDHISYVSCMYIYTGEL